MKIPKRCGSVVVSTSAWCKNLDLNIRDCVSVMEHGSSVVEAPLRKLGKFIYPTMRVSFGSLWFYLVSLPGEVKEPTQGVNV